MNSHSTYCCEKCGHITFVGPSVTKFLCNGCGHLVNLEKENKIDAGVQDYIKNENSIVACEKCGNQMVQLVSPGNNSYYTGWYYCTNCHIMENNKTLFNAHENQDMIIPIPKIADNNTIEFNKVYTLAYTKILSDHDEQTTRLIDEDKKIVMTFYTDGYDGINAKYLKGILNFLGVKYFECVYNKFPEKYYKEYKEYDWRSGL